MAFSLYGNGEMLPQHILRTETGFRDGGHPIRTGVARMDRVSGRRVKLFSPVLMKPVGPLRAYVGGEPATHGFFKLAGADGEKLCAMVHRDAIDPARGGASADTTALVESDETQACLAKRSEGRSSRDAGSEYCNVNVHFYRGSAWGLKTHRIADSR